MHIGFDVSQTGAGKAGCGYYADAMLQALLRIAPAHRFSLYPGFGDFYFDPRMPLRNPYPGANAEYGPRHLTRESAAAFWNAPGLADALGRPDIVHANNFWCPLQPGGSRLVYTLYDLAFLVDPSWTTEANRIGCFEGVFRSVHRRRLDRGDLGSLASRLPARLSALPGRARARDPPVLALLRRRRYAGRAAGAPARRGAGTLLAERGHHRAAQEPAPAGGGLRGVPGARRRTDAAGARGRAGLAHGGFPAFPGRARHRART